MGNNFIFPSGSDPLLTTDSTLAQLEAYKQQLLADKAKMTQQTNKQPVVDNPWDDTEKELSSLTDEQKTMLMSDEQFVEVNNNIQLFLQELLNSLLKPEMLKNEAGNKLLKERLDIVKSLKKKVVKESNKRMELFKEYTEKYSDITWDEFIKNKG